MSVRRAIAARTPAPLKKARRAVLALAPLPELARRTRLRAQFEARGDAPLVSVVIATYNWSSVLRFAIASALAQTYPHLEVVVVGDGCTDDSEEVVESFGEERVRWHNLPANTGSQSIPNNTGIGLARGEYVAYLGHDDLWLPSHLALLMGAVHFAGADLGYAVTELIGPPRSGFRRLRGLDSDEWGGVPPPSAVVHRKGLVDEIAPWRDYRAITALPDDDFMVRARQHGARFVTSQALTVIKFPSALRPNSYVTKLCEDQERYSRRMREERGFVARELAALALALVRTELHDRLDGLPQYPERPDPVPPGWYVTEARRIRGLE